MNFITKYYLNKQLTPLHGPSLSPSLSEMFKNKNDEEENLSFKWQTITLAS